MIYLDSAATTFHKPEEVARAMERALKTMTSPGRGGHCLAAAASQTLYTCREEAAALFDVPDPTRVVFTCNATHGLNIAIRTLVKPGSTVVISGYEHNAVTRVLHLIPDVNIKIAASRLFDQGDTLSAFERALTDDVSAVITVHVSNVFGFVLPIEGIARLCRKRGIALIVDASQSAGCRRISMRDLNAAFVAMPGHKGLYGPQGTGLLLCGAQAEPLLAGGTGSESISQRMPQYLPDRSEAGTHNMPGIAGLLEGLRFVRRIGVDRICSHEENMIRQIGAGLKDLPAVRIFMAEDGRTQSGVLSFYLENMDCEETGQRLAGQGIAVRAGLHCAPLAHATAGTLDRGTVRVSVSAFTTRHHVSKFLWEMRKMTE